MQHQDIPELDARALRQFGLTLGLVLAAVFGFVLPWVWEWDSLPNPWWLAASAAVVVWALAAPQSLRLLYKGWMRVALVIGTIVNSIILAFVFFIVITPMGLIMRSLGNDPMRRTLDRTMETYRLPSKVASRNHVERPF